MHARRPTCARRRARQCGLFRNRRWRREITQREAVTPKEGGAGWAALQRGRPRVAGIQGRQGGPAGGGRERAARFLGGFSVECAAPPAHACRAHDKHKWGHPPARRCAGRAPRLSPSASAVSGRSAGRGARRLFEPMDLETPGRFTMSHRDSVMLAEDVSALMGSQVSMDGARL